MPRKGNVFYKNELAGYISETDDGYLFQYDHDYLKKGVAISISLPLSEMPYHAKDLFPFFKGLLPEGWYLQIVSMTQKVDDKDLFGLLLANTNTDTIGAVTVVRVK